MSDHHLTPHLFSPISFKQVTCKNRIVVSPMCQYSAENGFANDWHLVNLGTRAVGGAGLVFSEAAAVSPEGRISLQDLGIWSDEHIAFLKRITQFIEANGAVPAIQLAHAGRKASRLRPWEGGGKIESPGDAWQPVAPSAIAVDESFVVPTELSLDDIQKVQHDFIAAAKRAYAAGFKIIELHAAHGYLLHEFLSPLSNQRQDAYGGSFENRIRMLLEIIDSVKQVWPHTLPLFVRISATDWKEGGWDLTSSIALASILKDKGIDLIDVSSGGLLHNVHMTVGSGYQTSFAAQIKREANVTTGAVGMITKAAQADHIIRTGQADMVFLGRELLRHPYWPLEAAHLLHQKITWPEQYQRAVFN